MITIICELLLKVTYLHVQWLLECPVRLFIQLPIFDYFIWKKVPKCQEQMFSRPSRSSY